MAAMEKIQISEATTGRTARGNATIATRSSTNRRNAPGRPSNIRLSSPPAEEPLGARDDPQGHEREHRGIRAGRPDGRHEGLHDAHEQAGQDGAGQAPEAAE